MTMRHLDQRQNTRLADVLLGTAKAVGVASIVAFLYPPSGHERSLEWLVAGCAVAAVLTVIGLSLVKQSPAGSRTKRGKE